ncbi:uncharacterized protein LOC143154038 [Ptiloglossa arizonensis]|uniref:uncharacterized protein LOC143154038 n=1 Tax=Ptiloglossa arizonensis TaxID=3350558 RepID=UPI003FA0F785
MDQNDPQRVVTELLGFVNHEIPFVNFVRYVPVLRFASTRIPGLPINKIEPLTVLCELVKFNANYAIIRHGNIDNVYRVPRRYPVSSKLSPLGTWNLNRKLYELRNLSTVKHEITVLFATQNGGREATKRNNSHKSTL